MTDTGWGSLYGILADARADDAQREEVRRNPVECPVHFVPLDIGPHGELHCTPGGHIVKV